MRLLLINPAEREVLRANLPLEIEQIRGNNPPISLLEVAAAARDWGGAEVRLIDAQAQLLTSQQVAEMAREFQPDLIGLSAVSFTMPSVLAQVKACKQELPGVPVWLGGLQPYLYPSETLAVPEIDGLVLGEGEYPIASLCRHWGNIEELKQAPGLYFTHNSEIIDTGIAPIITDLNVLPQPAFDLIKPELYGSVITDAHPVAIAVTSRGCPYRCTFCSNSVTGKGFRAHSVDYVVQNFERLKELGFASILVYDEVFTIDKQRVRDICAALQDRDWDLPWMIRATVGSVDEGMLQDLAAAGCEWITFGIESGSERVLKRLNKPVKLDKALEVFKASRRAGLKTLAYFMIGNPDEDESDLQKTEQYMRRLDADLVHIAVYTVYPATSLYDEGLKKDHFGGDVWLDFSRNPDTEFEPPLWPGPFSREELFSRARHLYRSYYLHPRRIWRELKNLRSWYAIKSRVKYARALVRS
jgi:anaerobic magnesium-protoporphyrin IX monomethyl ester cyclase